MPSRPLILVTSFEPFGGSTVNPTMLISDLLEKTPCICGTRAYLTLPVIGGVEPASAWSILEPALDALRPEAVIALGESGKADSIHFERIAINLRDSRIADNAGAQVIDTPVIDGDVAARFTTLPVREMLEACRAAEVAGTLSLSAGSFLCNELMYRLLAHSSLGAAGFIHVPQLPEQARTRGGPSMDLESATRGIHAALDACAAILRSNPMRMNAGTQLLDHHAHSDQDQHARKASS
jgi:pyroglutamyl-peptidase